MPDNGPGGPLNPQSSVEVVISVFALGGGGVLSAVIITHALFWLTPLPFHWAAALSTLYVAGLFLVLIWYGAPSEWSYSDNWEEQNL